MSGIGIVTAGQYTNQEHSGTILSPLDIALEKLSLKRGKQLQLVCQQDMQPKQEDRRINDVTINNVLLVYYIKQIDSVLSCFCCLVYIPTYS